MLVVDVGVAAPLDERPGCCVRKVRPGTADLAVEPAMTVDEAAAALDVGAEVAAELVADGARCLVTGEMGIGNTTPAAALIAALTGRAPGAVTGRGTGIDDATLARKVAVIDRALDPPRRRHRRRPARRRSPRSAGWRSRRWPASSSAAPPPGCRWWSTG